MGIAAYNRGNRCITRGLGLPVIGECTATPTPRPSDWGSKAAARAADAARRILAGAARYGRAAPDVDMLTACVATSARVGEATARAAAEAALKGAA